MSYIGNSPGVASQRVTTTLTATAGQTQFTTQSGYVLGYVDVYLNGAKLVNGSDFEAITGTYITLFAGATAGDVVELISYVPRGLSDGYTKAEADAKFLDVGGDTATGAINLGANGLVVGTNQLVAKNGVIGIGIPDPTTYKLTVRNTISNSTNTDKTIVQIEDMYNNNSNGQYLKIIGGANGMNLVSGWSNLHLGARGGSDGADTFTSHLSINGSGNVGIGTLSASSKLEVLSGTEASGQVSLANFRTGSSTAAYNAGLLVYGTASATATSRNVSVVWDADAANAVGGDYFYIQKLGNSGQVDLWQASNAAMVFSTNSTNRLNITGAGRLGIGIPTPVTLLHINTAGTARGLTIDNNYSGGAGSTTGMSVANATNDLITLRAGYGDNPETTTNNGMKWGIHFSGNNGDTWPFNGKSAAIYAVSEEAANVKKVKSKLPESKDAWGATFLKFNPAFVHNKLNSEDILELSSDSK